MRFYRGMMYGLLGGSILWGVAIFVVYLIVR